METLCESCGDAFVAKRSTARFCSATCRQRTGRAARGAAAEVVAPAVAEGDGEDTGLVASVRAELVAADRDQTFYGQLALQLAGRLADRDESGISSLSKELRTVMAAALDGVAASAELEVPAAAVEDDEVERARRRREESRQAAGLA